MLRWRLFGIQFCIEPSFWYMNALWAYLMYAYAHTAGNMRRDLPSPFTMAFLTVALIWIFCILVAVLVHELGHVITGRIFRQPGNITLTGMGGQAVGGYDELSPWKRILVIMMGPCAGFLLVAAIVALDGRAWNFCMDWMINNIPGGLFWENFKCEWFLIDKILDNPRGANRFPIYDQAVVTLFIISLFLNIMNLLPIIPMDGGMIFKEICVLISPRAGLRFAFIFSFGMATIVSLYLLLVVLVEWRVMTKPFELWYPFMFPEFSLLIFVSLAFRSYAVYRQLAAMERHSQYSQREYEE